MQPKAQARAESFIRGALIISGAQLVSRLLGAFYRPVVVRLFAPFDGKDGETGMGLTQAPASAFLIMLSISAMGINIAISRLIANRLAQGRGAAAWRVFRVSVYLMTGLGALMAVGFLAAAPLLARWAHAEEAVSGFRSIAPAIFLVSVMGALRGLFQGRQEMTPYALSQIWEQVWRIGVGVLLVYMLAPRSVALGAAGFNFGPAAGAVAGLAYLVWAYRRHSSEFARMRLLGADEPAEPVGAIMRQIFSLAAPIATVGAVEALLAFADAMLVVNRLVVAGVAQDAALAQLGQLINSYSLIMLAPAITNSLYISLIPAIAESLARGDQEQARARAATAYRLTLLIGLPTTVGLFVLSDEIYRLFFLSNGGPVLAAIALANLFQMLQQTSSGILQGAGENTVPARNFLVGFVLKVALTYWLVSSPEFGARGAAVATVFAYGAAAGLNLVALRRRMGKLVGLLGSWIKPTTAAVIMGIAALSIQYGLTLWLGPRRLLVVLTILLAIAVYCLVLVSIRGLRSRDLLVIPRWGPWLEERLRRRRLLME